MSPVLVGFIATTFVCVVVAIGLLGKSRRLGLIFTYAAVLLLSLGGYGCWPLMFPQPDPTAPPPPKPDPAPVSRASFEPFRPNEVPSDGYVTAEACVECHRENHASWYASYHRTMTQVATPEAVIGDFEDSHASIDQYDFHLTRQGDTFWAEMPTALMPGSGGEGGTVRVPIVMTTGSHHMQVYWFPLGASRMIGQLPLVYLKETNRWVPRNSCFLEPPGRPPDIEMARWNNTCLQCHTTHPKQRLSRNFRFDTNVAEFGISCEACHGPGQAHIDFHRANANDRLSADPIVNPEQLDHRLSSQVCGNCHSITTHLDSHTRNHGHAFRPGKSLQDSRHLYRRDEASAAELKRRGEDPDEYLDSLFWNDGMVRVSGREYNGLIDSACFQQGELSCISCHAVHQQADDPRDLKTWANDQLAFKMDSDLACVGCHSADQYGPQHTHHLANSAGSRCYNCHMPHTTYGLLKAIRSHAITSPNVGQELAGGRPGACNLCHLDKPIGWTADHLSQWYNLPEPKLTDDQNKIAAGVLWALRGDAGVRALAAWHMGWKPAQEASDPRWMVRYLSHLLDDPYDVVRHIASRSLKSINGFQTFDFNFVAPRQQRLQKQAEALSKWQSQPILGLPDAAAVLFDENGKLNQRVFSRISQQRDDRPMMLNE
ncbi:MAG: C cytochrome precursor [Pirellulales bacterium]|nr:C cytochrome precursor [Pirellulales bacterium]